MKSDVLARLPSLQASLSQRFTAKLLREGPVFIQDGCRLHESLYGELGVDSENLLALETRLFLPAGKHISTYKARLGVTVVGVILNDFLVKGDCLLILAYRGVAVGQQIQIPGWFYGTKTQRRGQA